MIERLPLNEVHRWIGREFVSPWLVVDQQRIQAFADATGDDNWIHLDEDRAASVQGGTIAHGFLILTLLPGLSYKLYEVSGTEQVLNYGVEGVRFTAPVRSGTYIRLRLSLTEIQPKGQGTILRWQFIFDRQDRERPACVGQMMTYCLPTQIC